MSHCPQAHAGRGFTLIEMMVTVALVGILAAVALPSYDSFIQKARRTEAKAALVDLASRQEKFYSINNKYTATAADLGYGALPVPTESGLYTLSLTANASSYTAKATPRGAQAKDVQCYGFAINDTGRKSNFSAAGNALTADCW